MIREQMIVARLQPVADELLAVAHLRASEMIAAAESDAGALVMEARAEAERRVAEAVQAGVRAAEGTSGRHLTRAHREAREMALAARRAAYESIRTLSLERLADRLQQSGNVGLELQLGAIVDRVLASETAAAV